MVLFHGWAAVYWAIAIVKAGTFPSQWPETVMKLSDVQDEDGDTPYSFVPNPDFDTFKISSAQQEKALICLIYALLYGWNCHGTYINWGGTPADEGEGHTSSVQVANGRETLGINRGTNNHQEGPSARRRRRQRQNRRANNDQGQPPESAQYREEPSRNGVGAVQEEPRQQPHEPKPDQEVDTQTDDGVVQQENDLEKTEVQRIADLVSDTPPPPVLDDALKELIINHLDLECPVCFDIPDAEIFQCMKGHLICSMCRKKLKKCPTCRENYTRPTPRNIAMERLISLANLKEDDN